MRAVCIPTIGPVDVIELAESCEDDSRAFLRDLYSVIGCDAVECVTLTSLWDAWIDETGLVDGVPFNRRATLLAQSCGFPEGFRGVVVVVGVDREIGIAVGLTDDQVEGVRRRVGEFTGVGDD